MAAWPACGQGRGAGSLPPRRMRPLYRWRRRRGQITCPVLMLPGMLTGVPHSHGRALGPLTTARRARVPGLRRCRHRVFRQAVRHLSFTHLAATAARRDLLGRDPAVRQDRPTQLSFEVPAMSLSLLAWVSDARRRGACGTGGSGQATGKRWRRRHECDNTGTEVTTSRTVAAKAGQAGAGRRRPAAPGAVRAAEVRGAGRRRLRRARRTHRAATPGRRRSGPRPRFLLHTWQGPCRSHSQEPEVALPGQ